MNLFVFRGKHTDTRTCTCPAITRYFLIFSAFLCCFPPFYLDIFAMVTKKKKNNKQPTQTAEWQRPGQSGWRLSGPPAETAHLAIGGQSLLSHSHECLGRTQNPRSTVSPLTCLDLRVFKLINVLHATKISNQVNWPNVLPFDSLICVATSALCILLCGSMFWHVVW